jgi:hypothetical protein
VLSHGISQPVIPRQRVVYSDCVPKAVRRYLNLKRIFFVLAVGVPRSGRPLCDALFTSGTAHYRPEPRLVAKEAPQRATDGPPRWRENLGVISAFGRSWLAASTRRGASATYVATSRVAAPTAAAPAAFSLVATCSAEVVLVTNFARIYSSKNVISEAALRVCTSLGTVRRSCVLRAV